MSSHSTAGERVVLAFDFGLKRIGVAIGHEQTGIASPLTTVIAQNNHPNWEAINSLINEWKPDALVLGLPVHMDGSEHEMTILTRKFGQQLATNFGLPVYEIDERLSSYEAEEQLKNRGKLLGKKTSINKKNKNKIDEIAAQIILQDWLNQ